MKRQTFSIEIITPCFCAGADQSKAEIRAASIRGQLRWWFRLISGDAREEAAVFGSVNDDDDSHSAAVSIRVKNFKSGPKWEVPTINQNTPENYVWHYASVSGTTVRGAKGPRWSSSGAIAPGSTFDLELIWKRPISRSIQEKFDLTLNAFLALGTLGLRSTRGLGSLYCSQTAANDMLDEKLSSLGIVLRWRTDPQSFNNYEAALRDYATWLRYDFRKQIKAERLSPLGSSTPRQTSAVRFRPIKLTNGKFGWLAYEAPQSKVLGAGSRTSRPFLENKVFQNSPPAAPAQRGRY